jgi:hypothetical protein
MGYNPVHSSLALCKSPSAQMGHCGTLAKQQAAWHSLLSPPISARIQLAFPYAWLMKTATSHNAEHGQWVQRTLLPTGFRHPPATLIPKWLSLFQ